MPEEWSNWREWFPNKDDFDSFQAWAIEGSCLAQRMSESAPGGIFTIPGHWELLKDYAEEMTWAQ